MKRTPILYICIALASIMLLGGCKERSKQENVMYVSIAPIKYIVEQIVGDDFRIEVLVPAGASPETFEPLPLSRPLISVLVLFVMDLLSTYSFVARSLPSVTAERFSMD